MHGVIDGFLVFTLVLVPLWSSWAGRRYKQKYEGQNRPHECHIVYIMDMSHMRILSRQILPNLTLSYLAKSCQILLFHILPNLAKSYLLPNLAKSYLVISCQILTNLTFSYLAKSCRILPCHILQNLNLSYITKSCLILPCHILPNLA